MAEKETKKTKRPTAVKRDMQSKRRRLDNRVYRSRVRTAIRAFQESLEKGDAAITTEKLNETTVSLTSVSKRVFLN